MNLSGNMILEILSLLPCSLWFLRCLLLATTIAAISSAKWFKTCFFSALNSRANAIHNTCANISKSRCVNHLNSLLPKCLRLKGKLLEMHMQSGQSQKELDHTFSALMIHCASLVNSDIAIYRQNDGLRWRKRLVNLALNLISDKSPIKKRNYFRFLFTIWYFLRNLPIFER